MPYSESDSEAVSSRPGKRPKTVPATYDDIIEPVVTASGRARTVFTTLQRNIQALGQQVQAQEQEYDEMKFDLDDLRGQVRSLKHTLRTTQNEFRQHRLDNAIKIGGLTLQLTKLEQYKQEAMAATALTATYRTLLAIEKEQSARLQTGLRTKDSQPKEASKSSSDRPVRSDNDPVKEGKLPKVNLVRAMRDAHQKSIRARQYAKCASESVLQGHTGVNSHSTIVVKDDAPRSFRVYVRSDSL